MLSCNVGDLMKWLNRNKWSVISFFVVVTILVTYMVIKNVIPFGDDKLFVYFDGYYTVYYYLYDFYDKLKSGSSFSYFWNNGFGFPFLATYFWYLASPLNFLIVLFGRDNILAFVSITCVIKIAASSAFFAFYLNNKTIDKSELKKKIYILPISMAYGLSTFVLTYSVEPMWLDSLAVLPLIMYGFNKMIYNKKSLAYILFLTLGCWLNFYMLSLTALFLIICFLWVDFDSLTDFFKKGIRFTLTSLVSVGLSSIPIMVSLFAMSDTAIVENVFPKHYWFGNVFEIIRELFIFTNTNIYSDNIISTNIYCGIFSIVLLFSYIFLRGYSKRKIRNIFFVVFFIIGMNESILNYSLHLFHSPRGIYNRFSFLFVFVLLDISYECILEIKKENVVRSVPAVFLSLVLPVICYWFVNLNSSVNPVIVIFVMLGLSIFYHVFITISVSDNKIGKVSSVIFTIVMALEILVNTYYFFDMTIPDKKAQVGNTDSGLFCDAINSTESTVDDGILRSVFLYNDNLRVKDNYGSELNVNTISCFSSYLYSDIGKLMGLLGNETAGNIITDHGKPEVLEDIFSEGIIYVEKTNDNYLDRINYLPIYEDEKVVAYKNRDALPIGFGASKSALDLKVSENANNKSYIFDNYDPFYYINNIVSILCGDIVTIYNSRYPDYSFDMTRADDVEVFNNADLNLKYADQGYGGGLVISFNVPEDGVYYINYLSNVFENVQVYVNDQLIKNEVYYDVTNGILYLGKLIIGDSIKIVTQKVSNKKVSDIYNCLGVVLFDQTEYEKFLKYVSKNVYNVTEMKDDYINGEITLDDDQILVTSIPYDTGWRVYDNGVEVEKKKVLDAFIGLDLGSGKHNIEFKYSPKGLTSGFIITVITLLIVVIYYVLNKKRQQDEI